MRCPTEITSYVDDVVAICLQFINYDPVGAWAACVCVCICVCIWGTCMCMGMCTGRRMRVHMGMCMRLCRCTEPHIRIEPCLIGDERWVRDPSDPDRWQRVAYLLCTSAHPLAYLPLLRTHTHSFAGPLIRLLAHPVANVSTGSFAPFPSPSQIRSPCTCTCMRTRLGTTRARAWMRAQVCVWVRVRACVCICLRLCVWGNVRMCA